jgi:hypothetical protein
VREDQAHVRVPAADLERVLAERRDSAPGVTEHGDAALVGEREHGLEVRVVERERLGARVQLDAAGAGVERALRPR